MTSENETAPTRKADLPSFDIVYLDLHGTLLDLVGAVFKAHNRRLDYISNGWAPGEYDMSKCFGIPEAKMWEKTSELPDFWRNLPKLPNFQGTVDIARSLAPVIRILTKPFPHENCYAGTFAWCSQNLPDLMLCMHRDKSELARPGRLLIDDSDENCDAFRAAGGSAILFPQHWNSAHDKAPFGPLFYLAQELAKLKAEQDKWPIQPIQPSALDYEIIAAQQAQHTGMKLPQLEISRDFDGKEIRSNSGIGSGSGID